MSDFYDPIDSGWRHLYSPRNAEGNILPVIDGKDSNMSSTSSILQFPLHSVLGLARTEDVLVLHLLAVLDGLFGHLLRPVLLSDRGLLGRDGLAVA